MICPDFNIYWVTALTMECNFLYAEQPSPDGLTQGFLLLVKKFIG